MSVNTNINININKNIRSNWSNGGNGGNIKDEVIFKLNSLKHIYKGKKALILTCGPSMNKVSKEVLQKFVDKGYIIVCVKQAIEQMPNNFAHFHVYNFCNEKNYTYNRDLCDTISVYCQKESKLVRKSNVDIVVSHIPHNEHDNILTAMIEGRDEMTFEKLIGRPNIQVKWGDIMYELAIPLCIQIGCSEVYVIGWDCKNFSDRFYSTGDGNSNETRNSKRKNLDQLQLRASKNVHDFLKRNFNLSLKLTGEKGSSALNIPFEELSELV